MSDGQALHDREGQAFTRDLRPRRQRVKRIGRQPDLVKDAEIPDFVQERRQLSDADLVLLRKHCPVAYFHKCERMRPCTVGQYISQCMLYSERDGRVLLPAISEDGRELLELARASGGYVREGVLRYHGPGLARLRDREIEDVPFYGNVVRTSVGGVDVASLQYLMLYPVNYGYRCCCCCWVGWHDADWEQCRVVISERTGKVLAVSFRAHDSDQGQWATARECEFYDEERCRPVVYVTPGSHGVYRTPHFLLRIFGAANERLGKHIPWNARSRRVEPLPEVCFRFRGWFGPCCSNPAFRYEFNTLGPTGHITGLQRFFYPLSAPFVRQVDLARLIKRGGEVEVTGDGSHGENGQPARDAPNRV